MGAGDDEARIVRVASFTEVFAESTVPLTVVISYSSWLAAATDVVSSPPAALLPCNGDPVRCVVGGADVELLCFGLCMLLFAVVIEAFSSADAVVVDPFVACTELESLVDSCSACVVPVVDGSAEAVKLPIPCVEGNQVEATHVGGVGDVEVAAVVE